MAARLLPHTPSTPVSYRRGDSTNRSGCDRQRKLALVVVNGLEHSRMSERRRCQSYQYCDDSADRIHRSGPLGLRYVVSLPASRRFPGNDASSAAIFVLTPLAKIR